MAQVYTCPECYMFHGSFGQLLIHLYDEHPDLDAERRIIVLQASAKASDERMKRNEG